MPSPADAEVVLLVGIPGAGKSRLAESFGEGFVRLNRDERGGSLRDVAEALDEALASGARHVVLDNTYLTRAARSYAIEAAGRHGVTMRCVWLDTPLAQAQVNLVERVLERFGRLLMPDELREAAKAQPDLLSPTSQMRALRELEPPSINEGFTSVHRRPFVRARSGPGRSGVLVAASALATDGWKALSDRTGTQPHLVFDWRPGATVEDLAGLVERVRSTAAGPVEAALCAHGGGPPSCWCRPPLPGLPLAWARSVGVDLARSTLIGTSSAHRTLATTVGARSVTV